MKKYILYNIILCTIIVKLLIKKNIFEVLNKKMEVKHLFVSFLWKQLIRYFFSIDMNEQFLKNVWKFF